MLFISPFYINISTPHSSSPPFPSSPPLFSLPHNEEGQCCNYKHILRISLFRNDQRKFSSFNTILIFNTLAKTGRTAEPQRQLAGIHNITQALTCFWSVFTTLFSLHLPTPTTILLLCTVLFCTVLEYSIIPYPSLSYCTISYHRSELYHTIPSRPELSRPQLALLEQFTRKPSFLSFLLVNPIPNQKEHMIFGSATV